MTDTLQIGLNDSLIPTLTESVEKVIQHTSSELNSAWITVIGMFLVAVITVISQLIITKKVIVADINKLQIQALSDFDFKNRFDWIHNFRKIIADLMTITDPDCNVDLDKSKMTSLINQAQLMLDDSVSDEKEICELLTKLGIHSDYWNDKSKQSEISILNTQSDIANKTKRLLLKKQYTDKNN